MKIRLLLSMILVLGFNTLQSFGQINGWKIQKQNKSIMYTPDELSEKQEFTFQCFLTPLNIAGEKNQLYDFVTRFGNKIGVLPESWKFESEPGHIWTAYTITRFQDKPVLLKFYTKRINDKQFIIANLIADNDPKLLKKYASQYKEILEDAVSQISGNTHKSKKRITESKRKIELPPKPDFSPLYLPKIDNVIAAFNYTVDNMTGAAGGKETLILTFNDGKVTKDIETVLQKGVEYSLETNPKQWGIWRMVHGKLEIKWNNKPKYKKYDSYSYLKRHRGTDIRIHGCWTTSDANPSPGAPGDTHEALISTGYCFDKSGRFTKGVAIGTTNRESSSSGNSEIYYGGYSKGNKTGWYFINDNVIQLNYDNGEKQIFIFSLKDKKQKKNYYLRLGDNYYFNR